MNKNIFFFLCVLWCGVGMTACQEEQLTEYKDDPRVFFDDKQGNEMVKSFFTIKSEIDKDTAWLKVKTLGFPTEYDRSFAIVQSNTGVKGAAVAGVHYLSFAAPEMQEWLVIPAGKVEVEFPVVLFRDTSLQREVFGLKIAIAENEYFKIGLPQYSVCLLRISDKADKPVLWDSYWNTIFGTWSSVKMKFIIDYVGLSEFEERLELSYTTYLKNKANRKLEEYNEAHPGEPLCTGHNPALNKCDNCITFPK